MSLPLFISRIPSTSCSTNGPALHSSCSSITFINNTDFDAKIRIIWEISLSLHPYLTNVGYSMGKDLLTTAENCKKKVLLINGSPRDNGNTFTALSEVAKTLNNEGIETEIISIGKQAVQGCIACGMCGRNGAKCTFRDDLY